MVSMRMPASPGSLSDGPVHDQDESHRPGKAHDSFEVIYGNFVAGNQQRFIALSKERIFHVGGERRAPFDNDHGRMMAVPLVTHSGINGRLPQFFTDGFARILGEVA